MEIRLNVTGERRKELVTAVSKIVGWAPVYMKAPSFAYVVSNYTIDKDGTLHFDERVGQEDVRNLLARLAEQSFVSEDVLDENATDAAIDDGRCAIEFPLEGFTATALDNLERLVAAKAWVIKKMIGADELPIERGEGCLRFPWFRQDAFAIHADAYSRLITGLCETAKKKQRIVATERQLDEGDNEKFKARCFLLSIGFIGPEYAQARKVLLKLVSGSGSHKSGNHKPKQVGDEAAPDAANLAQGGEDSGDGVGADDDGLAAYIAATGANSLAEAFADAELIHSINALLDESGTDDNAGENPVDVNHEEAG